ncbi:hypothetical protein GCM10012275_27170 [Longimycelium tulufanense]|uniref:DUF4440 domain-containing protein n=1 Tax=Longimycelium tulufanense TaxID=907463 RepID=A0A8J3C8I7_9PSEU|nr:nuclear transport factor 2 family protein [Longimycelium tulufanense]GGM54587.1 hypothetical protein GCM10012275_27170 [Longimycelium tulufanense]
MPVERKQQHRDTEWTSLSSEALERAIGDFTVDSGVTPDSGVTAEQVAEVRQAIKKLVAKAATISDKYIKIKDFAKKSGRSFEELVDPEEFSADRAVLNRIVADEYRLVAPHGEIVGKEKCINRMLHGAIRPQSLGPDGFETTEDTLQVHGNTAVSVGTFRMKGKWLTEHEATGEITEEVREFSYRTMHSFTFRNGRWQITASQMTDLRRPPVRFATGPGTDRPADWRPEDQQ